MFSREPYPGLRSFRKDESDIFFGRDDHVAGMIRILADTHFLCVTGSSGCGKSSLARTGLQNALEAGFLKGEGSDWIFCDFHPGNRPLENLLDALSTAAAEGDDAADADTLVTRAANLRQLFADHIEQRSHDLSGALDMISEASGRPVLILVDQFEELFRYAIDQPYSAVTFVDVLLKTAGEKKKVYVAITIRTDELHKCSRYRDLTDVVNDGQFLTPDLDRSEVKEAIEGPIAVFGGKAEPALSTWLLNSLKEEYDKLPLMQHALRFLYRHKLQQQGGDDTASLTLTLDDMYMLLGGYSESFDRDSGAALRQFLSQRMDAVYAATPERLQRPTQALFCALTDIDSHGRDIRQAVPLGRLQKILGVQPIDVIDIVERYRAEGYLRPEPGQPLDPGTNIDVTHECVLRTWSRLQSDWLVQEQRSADNVRDFVRDAYSYESQHSDSTWLSWLTGRDLLIGSRFRLCDDWFRKAQPTPTWAERYLDPRRYTLPELAPDAAEVPTDVESLFGYLTDYLNRSRHFAVWRQWRAAGLATIGIVALAGGAFAYFNYQDEIRREQLVNAVKLMVAQGVLNIPDTPVSTMILGDNPAFAEGLKAHAATLDAGIDPIVSASTPICNGLAPGADPVALVEAPPPRLACDLYPLAPTFEPAFGDKQGNLAKARAKEEFDAGGVLMNIAQTRATGRTLIASALSAQPGVPIGYRYLAWTYGSDATQPESAMLAQAGRCFARAIAVACLQKSDITQLAYGVEALSQAYDQYPLRFQQAVLHGQLAAEFLDLSWETTPAVPVKQVERRRRGAEALAFSAHYLRQAEQCADTSSPRCQAVDGWYDHASQTFFEAAKPILAPDLPVTNRNELAFGAGMFGLFWSQDRAFRTAARKYTNDAEVIAILQKALDIRAAAFASLPRYTSVLAMAQCIAGRDEEARTTAERIDQSIDKYKDIYARIQKCGSDADRESLFENETISK
jgi:hypothetical protein